MRTRFSVKYSLALAALVVVGFVGICAAIFSVGRTPVWSGDELYQWVNRLVYYGETTRGAFASLIAGNGFDFPAYTLNQGYGMDTATLLGGAIGDVFDIVAIFVPPEGAEYLYVGLILVRLMASAFTFSFYCFQRGNDRYSTLVGALCYTFSGFGVFVAALRHPFFLTALALFPLVMAGIDHVFDKRRPWLFVVAMALQFAASVYYAYMTCLAMLAYCLVKYFTCDRKRSLSDFVLLVLRFAGLLLLAFGIAAVLALPRILALMSQGRLKLERESPLLYQVIYYLCMPSDVLGITHNDKGAYLGIASTILIIVFIVRGKQLGGRQRLAWTIGLVLVAICTLVPYPSRVLNGFSYATNRWAFIAAFVCAYSSCMAVPLLKGIKRKNWAVGLVVLVVLTIAYEAVRFVGPESVSAQVNPMLEFSLVAAFVLAGASMRFSKRAMAGVLAFLIVVGASASSWMYYTQPETDRLDNFARLGSVNEIVFQKSHAAAADGLVGVRDSDPASLWRYSPAKAYGMRNGSLNHDAYGVDFYNSTYNQPVDDFRTELGLSDDFMNFRYVGSESRMAVEALTGVRYFVAKDADTWRVPYGFEATDHSVNGMGVWETSTYLPLAFSTPYAIARSDYDALDMAEKQEALLQGCVVADNVASEFQQADIATSSESIACTIKPGKNVALAEDGKSLTVLKENASVKLTFEGLPRSETYVRFEGLRFVQIPASELAQMTGTKAKGGALADLLASHVSDYYVTLADGDRKTAYNFATGWHSQYGGKMDWLLNAGYADEAKTTLKLSFSEPGTYTFEDLSIVCQPVERLVSEAGALAEGGATELSFDGNGLSATFDIAEGNELAVLTVPYSTGWSATVDGAPADVLRADTAFLAVELQGAGSHSVRLNYSAPGQAPGALLSIACTVGFAVWIIVSRIRRRKLDDEPRGKHAATNRTASHAGEPGMASKEGACASGQR